MKTLIYISAILVIELADKLFQRICNEIIILIIYPIVWIKEKFKCKN